jgi:hypothetical protein
VQHNCLFEIIMECENATIAKHSDFHHFLCITGAQSHEVSMRI